MRRPSLFDDEDDGDQRVLSSQPSSPVCSQSNHLEQWQDHDTIANHVGFNGKKKKPKTRSLFLVFQKKKNSVVFFFILFHLSLPQTINQAWKTLPIMEKPFQKSLHHYHCFL
jgi:hypothetical protein